MSDNIEDIEKMKEDLRNQVYGSGEESGNGDVGQEGQQLVEAKEDGGNGNGNGNGGAGDKGDQGENSRKGKKEKKKERREILVYKYSNKKKWNLHEAVILSGSPAFLYCENSHGNNHIDYVSVIEENTRIIKPPHEEHYPYEPYEFEDMNEVLSYVERARKETIDSLYLQAKQIASDYYQRTNRSTFDNSFIQSLAIYISGFF